MKAWRSLIEYKNLIFEIFRKAILLQQMSKPNSGAWNVRVLPSDAIVEPEKLVVGLLLIFSEVGKGPANMW